MVASVNCHNLSNIAPVSRCLFEMRRVLYPRDVLLDLFAVSSATREILLTNCGHLLWLEFYINIQITIKNNTNWKTRWTELHFEVIDPS